MPSNDLTLDLRSYSRAADSHQHDYHQLVLPVSGELEMTVNHTGGRVDATRASVIPAGQEHAFSAPHDNCFVVADIPDQLAPELEKLPAFIELTPALAQYVSFLHLQLQQQQTGTSQRQMLLLLLQLLQEQYGKAATPDRRIAAAQSHLDQHFSQPVTVAQLARIASLSPRHLSTLFRQSLGMTPQQYLLEKRMQRAWQLLSQSGLSIQQVAEQVGYQNLSAFSDRFRKHFNHPPSYFRRSGK